MKLDELFFDIDSEKGKRKARYLDTHNILGLYSQGRIPTYRVPWQHLLNQEIDSSLSNSFFSMIHVTVCKALSIEETQMGFDLEALFFVEEGSFYFEVFPRVQAYTINPQKIYRSAISFLLPFLEYGLGATDLKSFKHSMFSEEVYTHTNNLAYWSSAHDHFWHIGQTSSINRFLECAIECAVAHNQSGNSISVSDNALDQIGLERKPFLTRVIPTAKPVA